MVFYRAILDARHVGTSETSSLASTVVKNVDFLNELIDGKTNTFRARRDEVFSVLFHHFSGDKVWTTSERFYLDDLLGARKGSNADWVLASGVVLSLHPDEFPAAKMADMAAMKEGAARSLTAIIDAHTVGDDDPCGSFADEDVVSVASFNAALSILSHFAATNGGVMTSEQILAFNLSVPKK